MCILAATSPSLGLCLLDWQVSPPIKLSHGEWRFFAQTQLHPGSIVFLELGFSGSRNEKITVARNETQGIQNASSEACGWSHSPLRPCFTQGNIFKKKSDVLKQIRCKMQKKKSSTMCTGPKNVFPVIPSQVIPFLFLHLSLRGKRLQFPFDS